MKKANSTIKLHLLFCIFILGAQTNLYAQLTAVCGEDFYGVGHTHIQCNQNDIVITSTSAEGLEGTIVQGQIFSLGKINIIPGYSKVRIIPEAAREPQSHRTKVGNGGNNGGNDPPPPNHSLQNSMVVYPNPSKDKITLSNFDVDVIGYEIINPKGIILKRKKISKKSDLTISIEDLKTGSYIINISLITGETITKLIIKE